MARAHFYAVNRLYEEALQSWMLFATLKPYVSLQTRVADFWETISENEDLLLPIARNAKNQTVVLLYILFDNDGQGRRGHNIYKLIDEFSHVDSGLSKLGSLFDKLLPAIRKLRILRNSRMAHFCATDEWREGVGNGITAVEMRQLFSTLFNVLSACGKTFERQVLPPTQLQEITKLYANRLMNALKAQVESGTIGEKRISINDWHEIP